MSEDDVLFGYRLRLFALAGEIGVRAACRAMGVHHSTYYRWAEKVERWGLEALRPREPRRRYSMVRADLGQLSSAEARASSRSRSVIPPAEWVTQRRVTRL